MRRAFLALFAVLALAPAAQAKGPVALEVCGVSGCVISPERDEFVAFMHPSELEFAATPPLAPYFEIRAKAYLDVETIYRAERVTIGLRSKRVSPWTDGEIPIDYVPSRQVVFKDGEWFRAPPALAARIEADAGLGRPAATKDPEPSWAAVGGIGAAVVLLTAAGVWAVRASRRRLRAPAL